MDVQAVIFGTLGGLAIFLFGMNHMSEGLEKIGSESMRLLLHALTRKRASAVLVGMGVTCFVQSSSATSVIVIGFVNAGLLQLEQAVAVVLGADIGTTITAWIVSTMGISRLSIASYALPVIAAGFLVNFIARSQKRKMVGQTLIGFGLLFLGLGIMSDGVKAIRDSETVMTFFKDYGPNPVFGILTGMVFTCIIQSSSATIAIVQVMALQGLFGLETALPLMFGADIGTTITAQLAGIGGTRAARGVAMANTLFKVFAALIFLPLLISGLFQDGVLAVIPDRISPETGVNSTIMAQIAVAHSAYIVIAVLMFSTVLWRPLVFATRKTSFIDRDAKGEEQPRYLDPLLLKTPPIALEQCVREVAFMTRQCYKNVGAAFAALLEKNLKDAKRIAKREDEIDGLQARITAFLVELGRLGLSEEESRYIPRLIHCINDAERVGDHAMNLLELAQRGMDTKLAFSPEAEAELRSYYGLVDRQFQEVITALETRDPSAVAAAIEIEKQLDANCVLLSQNHVARLESGCCDVQTGIVFLDVLANIEKIGDHLTNIAERVQTEPAA